MAPLPIAVCGCLGRMGRLIAGLVATSPDLLLAGCLERPGHPAVGRPVGEAAPEVAATVRVTDAPAEGFASAEVVVDFTTPEATLVHLAAAVAGGKGMVIGTTGFTAEQRATVTDQAARTRTVMAANMSVGVNLLLAVLPQIARVLGDDYDVEVTEVHHRFKADAPSGTALALADSVAKALGRDLATDAVHGRHGRPGPRTTREIGLHAVRAGDVVGDHTVIFGGLGERIEVTHRAHSREVFARGAIRAARWVAGRPPGLYSMLDVLGLQGETTSRRSE